MSIRQARPDPQTRVTHAALGARVRLRRVVAWTLAAALTMSSIGAVPLAGAGQRRYAPAAASDLLIGLVTDTGGLGDSSFNDMLYAGLVRAHDDLGVEIQVVEPGSAAAFGPSIDSLVASGADMIFTTGFLLSDVTKQKANQYRSVKFVGADQNYSALTTNLAGVNFEEHEGAYLAGVVAALSTNATYDARLNGDNKIAFVGGMDIPPVERFEAGFVAGAQSVNYGIDVIGEYAGSFTDEARGEELAEDAIAQGADVVFAAAGATGLGCIQACQDHGALFIGVDNDQYLSIPGSGNVMLTSAMKRLDNAAYGIIEDLAGGTFVGGSNLYLGLAEDAVGVAPYHDFDAVVPQSIRNAVEAARAAVIGYVTVPDSRADLLGRTYLGMGVNPTVLPKYDATTTITGRLTFGSGITVPLVGEDVRIQTSSNGKSGWKTVKTLPSGFNGQFSWVTVPRSTAYYRLSYAGKTYRYASVNSSVMFKVVPKAYVGQVGGSRYGARSYTLYGTLKPKHANHTKPVLVYRWQRVAGHWKKYGTHLHAMVHDRGSFMRYEVKYRFPHKGTWQLRAYHPADSGQAATWGGYSELKVK